MTTLAQPADTRAMWNEVVEQSLLTHRLGEIECGRSTHRVPVCGYCGAMV